MQLSVVIATFNQESRLRLVLAGLEQQRVRELDWEVVVVCDGCTDGTLEAIDPWRGKLPMRVVWLEENQGRCRARNLGVQHASGDFIAFLDGDALPHPGWLGALWNAARGAGESIVLCGAIYSIESLEYVDDPATGEPLRGGTPSVVREWVRERRREVMICDQMIVGRFDEIERRAVRGGYPYPELSEVQRQTEELFREVPGTRLGWIGFYPHNALVNREAFLRLGGFDERIPFCEGWELAYSLQSVVSDVHYEFVAEARTYHLYHVHPFQDDAVSTRETSRRLAAIEYMARKHRDARLRLIHFWHAGIWIDPLVPEALLLRDLIDFNEVYAAAEGNPQVLADHNAVVDRHPFWGRQMEGSDFLGAEDI